MSGIVNNLKSTIISNRDASPVVLTDSYVSGGELRSTQGFITTALADNALSTYRLAQVPSNARVEAVKYQCAALGTSCTMNVGVYYPTAVPQGAGVAASLAGTAINATFFASAIASSSAVGLTDVTNQSGTNTIALQEQPLWQAVGLSADPMCPLDIVATVQVAVVNAALVGLKVSYVE